MTDLRDQLADLEATARRQLVDLITEHVYPDQLADKIAQRILDAGWTPPRTALCHPSRPLHARGLCMACYEHHRDRGTLTLFPRRQVPLASFAADYELLRSEGYTRAHIAERLGMRRNTVDAAYRRAVAAGALTPDRRTA